jgi:uncharacterized protein
MKESKYNIWVQRGEDHYVYNGVSGALLRMTAEHRAAFNGFLTGDPRADCPPSVLADLVLGRMLVNDDMDEITFLKTRYVQARDSTPSLDLTLVTSLGCNFDCPYCFEAKHSSMMNDQVCDAIVNLVRDNIPEIESLSINWFGGEPLVGKNVLLSLSDRLIAMCDEGRVKYNARIITNGYLLDKNTCAELRERRVSHAQVSLDGPPQVHNRMRPLAGGRGSFRQIVRNLHFAVDCFNVAIRINTDQSNIADTEELLQALAAEGFSDRLNVYLGQLVAIDDGAGAPSVKYSGCCMTKPEFAEAEVEFTRMATKYGFSQPSVPNPKGAPCTAVRRNDFVIGSEGELYKCYTSVGNPSEVIVNVRNYRDNNDRLHKWLKYSPFQNEECLQCIALPVCMGGCPHHAFDAMLYENRCGTFRYTHRQRVEDYVDAFNTKMNSNLLFIRSEGRAVTPNRANAEPFRVLA